MKNIDTSKLGLKNVLTGTVLLFFGLPGKSCMMAKRKRHNKLESSKTFNIEGYCNVFFLVINHTLEFD